MANRKQQTEIDKTLKKVDEGVLVFEQIWDKVYSAATSSQKEKYEGDLKKEIKKLQRLRDSIKTWQGDSNIKDKSKLDSARKLIEEKMEKFKICEKETKTKAFSKEGLALDRTDPKERAKREVGDWIGEAITKLRDQCDEFEAEIESLSGTGKKGKKGNQAGGRIDDLREHTERHQFHITMLERILRAVDNETVSCDEANDLKESIDYYIDANQEPDFYEDEGMYDALDLDAAVPSAGGKGEVDISTRDLEKKTSGKSDSSPPTIPSPPNQTRTAVVPKAMPATAASRPTAVVTNAGQNGKSPPKVVKQQVTGIPAAARQEVEDSTAGSVPKASAPPLIAPQHRSQPLLSNIVKGSTGSASQPQPQQTAASVVTGVTNNKSLGQILPESHSENGRSLFLDQTEAMLANSMQRTNLSSHGPADSAARSELPVQELPGEKTMEMDASQHSFMGVGDPMIPGPGLSRMPNLSPGLDDFKLSQDKNGDRSSRGNHGPVIGLSMEDMSSQLSLLDSASSFLPESAEMEATKSATRPYKPRNPAAVPPSFPTVMAPIFENPAIFQKFDVDTLFFIFYYQQGTYQQYLAARELKRQAWRFHKKYLRWFQRHEEPKVTNDDYEQGTYLYFDYVLRDDYGTGWCQRLRTEFPFHYTFLEDELPIK